MNNTPVETSESGSHHNVNVTVHVNTDPTPTPPGPRWPSKFAVYAIIGLIVVGYIAVQMITGGGITIAIP